MGAKPTPAVHKCPPNTVAELFTILIRRLSIITVINITIVNDKSMSTPLVECNELNRKLFRNILIIHHCISEAVWLMEQTLVFHSPLRLLRAWTAF